MLERAKIFAGTLIAAALTFGCQRETPAEKGAREGILLMGNGADPASLDPSFATGFSESKILNALFEGLLGADSKTLKPTPAAAKSWEVSDDGKTYRFKIDEKARWSDGEKLKSSDFAFAWKRILNPKLGAEYSSLLFPIKNAREVNLGKVSPDKLGVKTPSDDILEVELEYPTPNFPNMLSHFAFFPLPEHVLKKFGAQSVRDALWTRPQNMVSNGAFVLSEWRINDVVSVKKNPNFRASDKIFLNEIRFYPISNVNTEDMAFRAGQLHITESVAPARLESTRKKFPDALRNEDWLGCYYYIANTRRPPLDDPRVRRALWLAIDRKKIAENFLRGGQKPAYSFVPDGIPGYSLDDSLKLKENANEARKLLGKLRPKIKITYNTSEQHKPIAEAIQNMWRENLGIEAELYNLSWPAYLSARATGDFDIARASWVADFASPESFLDIFKSDSALNHGLYSNEKFDSLLRQAARDPKNRMKLLSEAEALLISDAPIIPIYFYKRLCLVSPLVEGWFSNPLDYHNYIGVRMVPENIEVDEK